MKIQIDRYPDIHSFTNRELPDQLTTPDLPRVTAKIRTVINVYISIEQLVGEVAAW